MRKYAEKDRKGEAMNVTLYQMKLWNQWQKRSAEQKRKEELAKAVKPIIERKVK